MWSQSEHTLSRTGVRFKQPHSAITNRTNPNSEILQKRYFRTERSKTTGFNLQNFDGQEKLKT
jgi:hypothetical protein